MNNHRKGAYNEQLAIAFFLKEGYEVHVPVVNQSRYDLLVSKNGVYDRVQVKTICKDGNRHRLKIKDDYNDDFDKLVAIWDPQNIYIFPSNAKYATVHPGQPEENRYSL